MNFQHWRAIVWLRWRLVCNQINRLGWFSRALLYFVMILALLAGVTSLFLSILLGIWLLPPTCPPGMVLVCDGMILAFLSSWVIGVSTDLRRSEPLSWDKFLHLPISPRGAFCLNYVSSLFSLSMVVFFPMMMGCSIVLAWKYGGLLLSAPLLTLAFFAMVTALTYQFRGWLAALMKNKRRRRTILTALTVIIILLSQIPNIVDRTLFRARERESRQARVEEEAERVSLANRLQTGAIGVEEHERLQLEMKQRRSVRRQARFAELLRWTRIANTYLPPLWLGAGIDGAAENRWFAAGLSFVGMFGLGCVGLLRSYGTTLKLYRGGFETAVRSNAASRTMSASKLEDAKSPNAGAIRFVPNWLERSVPGASDQQAAVAWMSFRSMIRAPEAQLALFAPIVVVLIVGISIMLGREQAIGPIYRPFIGLGICFFAMVGVSQLIQNQFGFDRDGFRALMLAPISERDLLIGKNLALLPVALTLGLLALCAMQVRIPLHWSHFLATIVQLLTMYLVTCLVGNLMSIVVPHGVAAGSLQPTNVRFDSVLMELLSFLLAPLGMLPALLPLGIEWWFANDSQWNWIPIYLLGAVFYLVILGVCYRWVIGQQAALLAKRKVRILEIVTNVSV